MSFLTEHKLLFGAVGIAVSSAAAGFAIGWVFQRRKKDSLYKSYEEDTPVSKYVIEYGMRETSPLTELRKVRIEADCSTGWFIWLIFLIIAQNF